MKRGKQGTQHGQLGTTRGKQGTQHGGQLGTKDGEGVQRCAFRSCCAEVVTLAADTPQRSPPTCSHALAPEHVTGRRASKPQHVSESVARGHTTARAHDRAEVAHHNLRESPAT